MMELGLIIIGLFIGGLITFLYFKAFVSDKGVPKIEIDRQIIEIERLKGELAKRLTTEEIERQYVVKALYIDLSGRQKDLKVEFDSANERILSLSSENIALQEKLNTQKGEIEGLQKKFQTEFEIIANKILETKTEKFTQVNKDNLKAILEPLGVKLEEFKQTVSNTYDKESRERFSLGKEVEKLVQANQKISEEANNLASALKGSSKMQGDWGERILENVLEKSGLRKDHEYFIQDPLKDDSGKSIINEEGRRMRPDVIISYPDGGKVIVDSKVSLNDYVKLVNSATKEEQQKALKDHINSIKQHIDGLSKQNYNAYVDSLDFVMMFVPIESAYIEALRNEPELWYYAYQKGILLISSTNLVAALRLISDLWKKDYQNKNAQEIANRGTLLYEKFVGFSEHFEKIGIGIKTAQATYDHALGQLKTGSGNLVEQAKKLKELGIKPKKDLPPNLLSE